MAANLIIATQFKAIDKFTNVVRKMTQSTNAFAHKSVSAFRRVDMAANKMVGNISRGIGSLGMAVGVAGLVMAMGSVINVFADFEQANASLSSVMTSATTQDLQLLAEDAKRLGATTAKTASEVVGLQEAFARLGFERESIINMTGATISGSIAMKGELADTAELVGAVVNSFDSFSSINAPEIIDQLTLSTQKSALNFEKLQTSLPIVSGVANAAKVPFTKLVSTLGTLSDAGIDASSSATALRKILSVSASKGIPYNEMLQKIAKSENKLKTATELFGLTANTQAVILANNIDKINTLDKTLQNAGGTADTAAKKQLQTLQGRLTLLSSAWEGFIQSIEDGTGPFSQFLSTVVEVASEILSLASGTGKATSELTAGEQTIRGYAETGLFMLNVLKWVGGAFLAMKIGIMAYNAVMFTVTAISKTFAAVQWLVNAAMTANPIGLIVVGIGLLVGAIVGLIYYWEEIIQWVATSDSVFAGFLRAVIYPLIDAFEKLGELWDTIANSTLGKKIGGVIDTVFGGGADEPLNADATIEKVRTERISKTENQKIDMTINDRTGRAQITKNTGSNIKITNTIGM